MGKIISAYILAGGESSRMGEDKGLILLHDKPIISYIINEIRKVTRDISIVTTNENYKQFNLPLYADSFTKKGPSAGIDTALQHAQSEWVFITSCDMPFINEASFRALLNHVKQHEITLCRHERYLEPMFSIFRKECVGLWRELLLQGTLKLSDYFSNFDTNFVEAKELVKMNPHLFFNVNTAEDLKLAKEWMLR